MFNGSLNCVYAYVLLVALFPIAVVLEEDDTVNVFNLKEVKKYSQIDINDEEDAVKRTYTLVETLRRTFLEFEKLFEDILEIVATSVPKIARDAEIFLAKLSNRTVDVFNTFNNKILNVGDVLLNDMFHNVERQLEAVRVEFQNLATSVDEHFNWTVNQLNHTLINNTEEYDWWTAHIKQKLRTLNNTKLYQDRCRVIEEFITNTTKELHSCCKITMKPMRLLCNSASSLITEAIHTVVNAIDRMQDCLEEKNSYLEYMLPCVNLVYDEISSLVSRAAQISLQINNMMPMKLIYTRSCFAIVQVDMNVRRNHIESNLFSN